VTGAGNVGGSAGTTSPVGAGGAAGTGVVTGAGNAAGTGNVTGTGNAAGTGNVTGTGNATGAAGSFVGTPGNVGMGTFSVEGGSASGAHGTGTDAGLVHLVSRGGLKFADALSASAAPPAPPAGGFVLGAGMLAADVTRAETIRVSGDVTATGADPIRTITSETGDIVIEGTLRGADLGAATQSVLLNAPNGTVFIAGAVDTSSVDQSPSGDAAGAITLRARSVVATGKLVAMGEDNGAGPAGLGANISVTTTGAVIVTGSVDASGGSGRNTAGAATGGGSGGFRITTNGDVWLVGPTKLHGGEASTHGADALGGLAGTLSIDSDGVVRLGGSLDARGGSASTDGGANAVAGAAGGLKIGQSAPPPGLEIAAALAANGGAGPDFGGKGATIKLAARSGDLHLGKDIDFSGGASAVHPGAGGDLDGQAGPDSGGVRVAAVIRGNGGSADGAGTAGGGNGGTVRLEVVSLLGAVVVEAAGTIATDGGNSIGTGVAGGGGDLRLLTQDGFISMAGELLARGGEAKGVGGTGALGGHINVFSDTNANGLGGALTIAATGLVNASGGAGTVGGSARNNGEIGVAKFPVDQQLIAVLLNSDSISGGLTDGELVNLGTVIARGAAANGSGGDVIYHGRQPGRHEDPLPGKLFVEADGTGRSGEFAAE